MMQNKLIFLWAIALLITQIDGFFFNLSPLREINQLLKSGDDCMNQAEIVQFVEDFPKIHHGKQNHLLGTIELIKSVNDISVSEICHADSVRTWASLMKLARDSNLIITLPHSHEGRLCIEDFLHELYRKYTENCISKLYFEYETIKMVAESSIPAAVFNEIVYTTEKRKDRSKPTVEGLIHFEKHGVNSLHHDPRQYYKFVDRESEAGYFVDAIYCSATGAEKVYLTQYIHELKGKPTINKKKVIELVEKYLVTPCYTFIGRMKEFVEKAEIGLRYVDERLPLTLSNSLHAYHGCKVLMKEHKNLASAMIGQIKARAKEERRNC